MELLVVVSIIALLVALLLPALGSAKEASRTIKCAGNLKQIGVGLGVYASDWQEHILPIPKVWAGLSPPEAIYTFAWSAVLDGMMGGRGSQSNDKVSLLIWACPSNGRGVTPAALALGPQGNTNLNYVQNRYITWNWDSAIGDWGQRAPKYSRLKFPSKAVGVVEYNNTGGGAIWMYPFPISPGHVFINHNNQTNPLYVDGHVKAAGLSSTLFTAAWPTLEAKIHWSIY